ncbi:protein FANTASTIC FOUR 3-like [Carya illinoinensis]|uniref:FAF domain-containing protein n=1 Tax=Carya illinoinensis TaxID=32201 RepID=A0A8T1RCW7_CARIL|nr:protein FANTASTIC FOUR 3-like [Carya illinoinensis]KAG6664459.1 hypothetical protein CIPAW_02G094400 [Carya illinoinensis]
MATIVCQGLQSCLDNTHTVEPKKVWLKVSSPTPHFSQPLELALRSCFSDSKTKETGQKYRTEEVCNKPCNSLNSHSSSNPDLGGWSFLQAISTNPEGPKETMDQKEKVYVHPLVKRSSSMLSEKSLQLCTENLGNETGTEINEGNLFSLPSSDSKRRNLPTREQNKSSQLSGAKKVNTQNFPPPLTTMSGSESLRVRPHREDGRLIIEAIKAPTTQSYFQAERSNGRLVLRFVKTCTTPSIESEEADDKNEENGASNEAGNGKERFDSDAIEEKQQVEEEEEEKEEEEDWDNEGERDVHLVGEGMDGNYKKNGEIEMRKEKFERPRRCKEDEQHGKNRLLEWEPLWVATS